MTHTYKVSSCDLPKCFQILTYGGFAKDTYVYKRKNSYYILSIENHKPSTIHKYLMESGIICEIVS